MSKERLIRLSAALKKLPADERVDPIAWAGRQPWFRKQGLRTVEDVVSKKQTVIYKDHVGWDAVEKFFDLLPLQAETLFCASMVNGRTPKEIAKRIDNMIRKMVS